MHIAEGSGLHGAPSPASVMHGSFTSLLCLRCGLRRDSGWQDSFLCPAGTNRVHVGTGTACHAPVPGPGLWHVTFLPRAQSLQPGPAQGLQGGGATCYTAHDRTEAVQPRTRQRIWVAGVGWRCLEQLAPGCAHDVTVCARAWPQRTPKPPDCHCKNWSPRRHKHPEPCACAWTWAAAHSLPPMDQAAAAGAGPGPHEGACDV